MFGDDELAGLYDALTVLGEELRAAGVGVFHPLFSRGQLPPDLGWGHHHMGMTAMSHGPAEGVVDPQLRVHGTQGHYVLGSSVFPSGGHVNPTLTVLALAGRLAAHLRAELAVD